MRGLERGTIGPWDQLAERAVVDKTAMALSANGIKAIVVSDAAAAKDAALRVLPRGAEVMNATSTTLDQIGLTPEILGSGKFNPVRRTLQALPQSEQRAQARRLLSVVDWVVGSVHAITQQGQVVVASASGSQLPPYIYTANHVLWVASSRKIVPSLDDALARVREHSLPLEDERARNAYGVGSAINNLWICFRVPKPDRATMLLVEQPLGF